MFKLMLHPSPLAWLSPIIVRNVILLHGLISETLLATKGALRSFSFLLCFPDHIVQAMEMKLFRALAATSSLPRHYVTTYKVCG